MCAVIFTLIFSLEKSSALQGVVTVKYFQFVLCGNCLFFFVPGSPWRLVSNLRLLQFSTTLCIIYLRRGISAEPRECAC